MVGAMCLAAPAAQAVAGYTARPCGLDLDRDGVIGEVADCQLCDGTTTFPDRELYYVDCSAGSDTGSGSPASPFRTIQKAFQSADGPEDGKADVVCFKGTCSGVFTPLIGGAPTSYARVGYRYPSNPTMLVGWDADNDGSYPPFDSNDTAVLSGLSGSERVAIDNNRGIGQLELAHFDAQDYGLSCQEPVGFMRVAYGGSQADYIYVHDLELSRINAGCTESSDKIVFNLFTQGTKIGYLAIENVLIDQYGGYLVRGSGVGTEVVGPYRFKNLTAKAKGAANDSAAGFKLWDFVTGIEILDNVFDVNVAEWTPCPDSVAVAGCQPTYAITIAQCSRDWTIRGNVFLDWKNVLIVQPVSGPGFCSVRAVDNVVFDSNVAINRYAPWRFGDTGILIKQGTDAQTTVEDISITNNFLYSAPGWESCIFSRAGNGASPNAGTVSIVGNTCFGAINRHASIIIGNAEGGESNFPQQSYIVKNNIVAGLGVGQVNINTQYAPSSLLLDGNVYSPAGSFSWNNSTANQATQSDLSEWRSVSGEGPASNKCVPAFRNATSGDLHLDVSDTCARDRGVDAASVSSRDIDAEGRPIGAGWDVGADELASGAGINVPTLLELEVAPSP